MQTRVPGRPSAGAPCAGLRPRVGRRWVNRGTLPRRISRAHPGLPRERALDGHPRGEGQRCPRPLLVGARPGGGVCSVQNCPAEGEEPLSGGCDEPRAVGAVLTTNSPSPSSAALSRARGGRASPWRVTP